MAGRLLTPGQVRLVQQVARLGIDTPREVAAVLRVPEDVVRRSFRMTTPLADELAELRRVPPLAPYPQHGHG